MFDRVRFRTFELSQLGATNDVSECMKSVGQMTQGRTTKGKQRFRITPKVNSSNISGVANFSYSNRSGYGQGVKVATNDLALNNTALSFLDFIVCCGGKCKVTKFVAYLRTLGRISHCRHFKWHLRPLIEKNLIIEQGKYFEITPLGLAAWEAGATESLRAQYFGGFFPSIVAGACL